MSAVESFWQLIGFASALIGAAACIVGAALIIMRGDSDRLYRHAIPIALLLTAIWCIFMAAQEEHSPATNLSELARNLSWIWVLYSLFAQDGRHETLKPIRPVLVSLAVVEMMQFGLIVANLILSNGAQYSGFVFHISSIFHMLVSIGVLLLLHNLFTGAESKFRLAIRWCAAGLSVLWIYDLNFYTVAFLGGDMSLELYSLRGLVAAAITVPLVIGSQQANANIRLQPSRYVTFQTLSLILIAAYLIVMIGIAQSLSLLDGGYGRLAQVGFVFAASALALIWLPSRHLRGWIRVTLLKHFFQHRYDYRVEWLRFTQTIGDGDIVHDLKDSNGTNGFNNTNEANDTSEVSDTSGASRTIGTSRSNRINRSNRSNRKDGDAKSSLKERTIKALANLTDSDAGALFQAGEGQTIDLAASWNWDKMTAPDDPFNSTLIRIFEEENYVVDLDAVRSGLDKNIDPKSIPDWLMKNDQAWALVPLLHFDRLIGVVALTRPANTRNLDWEDIDLLRVVGRQLASYLAEQASQQALMEAARFDEFNRRMSFVMHDIKNLASQLSLLSSNAERHADNPEFRADMLLTLKNSTGKLNALLARLGRYGKQSSKANQAIDPLELLRTLIADLQGNNRVDIMGGDCDDVWAEPEALSLALVHLVQNAMDSSEAGTSVMIDLQMDKSEATIEIIDSGCGMSDEFIRDGLFKPFVSTKNDGFGIGALEARELVQSMGGRLMVQSQEGVGSRFALKLPLAAAAQKALDERSVDRIGEAA